jgi:hypothetical protein
MKLFQVALVLLVFLVNLLFVQPSWADRPKLDENTDYQELTTTLDSFLRAKTDNTLPEGISSANELDLIITQLQYQKYIVENGEGVGICRNESGNAIAVYGAKSKKSTSTFDDELYILPDGEETDDDWNCDGVFIPNDVKVTGFDLEGASAFKILNGTELTIGSNPNTGALEFNLPPAKVLKAGDINWDIPDIAQADLNRTLQQAPTD